MRVRELLGDRPYDVEAGRLGQPRQLLQRGLRGPVILVVINAYE